MSDWESKPRLERHKITVPMHNELAIGTLNDILADVSIWNGISKDSIIDMLEDL
jgi:hypothetical protein